MGQWWAAPQGPTLHSAHVSAATHLVHRVAATAPTRGALAGGLSAADWERPATCHPVLRKLLRTQGHTEPRERGWRVRRAADPQSRHVLPPRDPETATLGSRLASSHCRDQSSEKHAPRAAAGRGSRDPGASLVSGGRGAPKSAMGGEDSEPCAHEQMHRLEDSVTLWWHQVNAQRQGRTAPGDIRQQPLERRRPVRSQAQGAGQGWPPPPRTVPITSVGVPVGPRAPDPQEGHGTDKRLEIVGAASNTAQGRLSLSTLGRAAGHQGPHPRWSPHAGLSRWRKRKDGQEAQHPGMFFASVTLLWVRNRPGEMWPWTLLPGTVALPQQPSRLEPPPVPTGRQAHGQPRGVLCVTPVPLPAPATLRSRSRLRALGPAVPTLPHDSSAGASLSGGEHPGHAGEQGTALRLESSGGGLCSDPTAARKAARPLPGPGSPLGLALQWVGVGPCWAPPRGGVDSVELQRGWGAPLQVGEPGGQGPRGRRCRACQLGPRAANSTAESTRRPPGTCHSHPARGPRPGTHTGPEPQLPPASQRKPPNVWPSRCPGQTRAHQSPGRSVCPQGSV